MEEMFTYILLSKMVAAISAGAVLLTEKVT